MSGYILKRSCLISLIQQWISRLVFQSWSNREAFLLFKASWRSASSISSVNISVLGNEPDCYDYQDIVTPVCLPMIIISAAKQTTTKIVKR